MVVFVLSWLEVSVNELPFPFCGEESGLASIVLSKVQTTSFSVLDNKMFAALAVQIVLGTAMAVRFSGVVIVKFKVATLSHPTEFVVVKVFIPENIQKRL